MPPAKLSTKQLKQARAMYRQGMTQATIGKFFGVATSTISLAFKRHKWPTRKYWNTTRELYSFNKHYFDRITSPNKAYFLGLLLADGSVVAANPNCLRLSLNDLCLIKAFKKDIKAEHPIKEYSPGHFRITICSKALAKSLPQHGLVPRKTFKVEFPTTVFKEFHRHLIRGYFDGDGCIYVAQTGSKGPRGILSFTGTYEMLDGIRVALFQNAQVPLTKIASVGKSYVLQYGARQSIRAIRDYMYYTDFSFGQPRHCQNRPPYLAEVFLPRKKAILDSFGTENPD